MGFARLTATPRRGRSIFRYPDIGRHPASPRVFLLQSTSSPSGCTRSRPSFLASSLYSLLSAPSVVRIVRHLFRRRNVSPFLPRQLADAFFRALRTQLRLCFHGYSIVAVVRCFVFDRWPDRAFHLLFLFRYSFSRPSSNVRLNEDSTFIDIEQLLTRACIRSILEISLMDRDFSTSTSRQRGFTTVVDLTRRRGTISIYSVYRGETSVFAKPALSSAISTREEDSSVRNTKRHGGASISKLQKHFLKGLTSRLCDQFPRNAIHSALSCSFSVSPSSLDSHFQSPPTTHFPTLVESLLSCSHPVSPRFPKFRAA